ncbi:membrane protein insertase YidC [Flocculibacter collagenilyticus]|uniref:membrane protein insertase YidC n=1 Tax=Flocculibacter collagenilyticus TaxID=2744479 RepID=UPI0018F68E21|nr:membrane protein insertase YidC [Flocculibacter collagenilyticus]
MESQRSFMFIGLLLVSFLLYQQWQLDYGPKPVITETQSQQDTQAASVNNQADDVPASSDSEISVAAASRQVINVKTNVFDIDIDTKGGDIISSTLLKFPVEQGGEEKLHLFTPNNDKLYIAQSGLVGRDGPDASSKGRPVYTSAQTDYQVTDGKLTVPLTYTNEFGMTFTKTFTFDANSYAIEVKYDVTNNTSDIRTVQFYGQLKQSIAGDEGSMMMPTYRGAAYSTQDDTYEKYDFDDMVDRNLNKPTLGGWVAMIQHYFVSAWIPQSDDQNTLYSRVVSGGNGIVGAKSSPIDIQPGENMTYSAMLYNGPKDQDVLEQLSPTLDLTVDYGIFWFISQPLFWLLKVLYGLVHNWGFAIILITIIVKTVMYPLTKAQYTSMAKMRNLQPKLASLKERYGEDRQKMGQAMMELYRKEKVNPMGGCLPMLIQMPIFLALYWVFLESTELRQAEFGLWITDLSAKDPYFVLPILFGASMFLMQKLQPTPMTDPMQQKIMMWMPVMFSVFFLWFPAGLVLYWLVSNLISIAQMLIIYRAMDKDKEKAKAK